MFADKIAGISRQQNPALFQKVFHKIALQLFKDPQKIGQLDLLESQYNIVETGFCPCGHGLIIVGLNMSPWDRWSYQRLSYDASILCPTCQDRFSLQVLQAAPDTDARAGDLHVHCIDDQHNYAMLVRPYYLWKMEATLRR